MWKPVGEGHGPGHAKALHRIVETNTTLGDIAAVRQEILSKEGTCKQDDGEGKWETRFHGGKYSRSAFIGKYPGFPGYCTGRDGVIQ